MSIPASDSGRFDVVANADVESSADVEVDASGIFEDEGSIFGIGGGSVVFVMSSRSLMIEEAKERGTESFVFQ